MTAREDAAWQEYEAAAEWCASQGRKGRIGDPLPALMSVDAVRLVNEDPEAFELRVRDYAYAQAMRGVMPDDEVRS